VHRIVNGIDTAAYAKKPKADALPRLIKREGENGWARWRAARGEESAASGARLRGLPAWHLVILGEGPEREAIRGSACGWVGHRVHMPGHVPIRPRAWACSTFSRSLRTASSSRSAWSRPWRRAGRGQPDVGDVKAMVRWKTSLFVPRATRPRWAMLESPPIRAGRRIGAANRARARAEYDEA
jgi:hypothetical protein